MMKSPEELLSEHLNGKFFWEHTVGADETFISHNVLEIRRAQKEHSKGAVRITAQNKNVVALEKVSRRKKIPLRQDQKILEPIILAIAEAYNISADDLLGRSTSYKFAAAKRHYYWAVFRYNPKLSSAEVGRIMGKNHTTIMHGRAMFQKKQDFAKVVEVERLLGLIA